MKIIKKMGNHHMTNDIEVHGIILWASIGLLMPLGILTIRMSNIKKFRRWNKLLFYFHAIFQTASVLLATGGAVLSVRNFENSFNNHHQIVGLVLYGAIWVQALTGFRRPSRGRKGRSLWYIVHWVLGTIISLVGIFNIYTGLQAYHKRTSKSTSFFVVLFTSQICLMAFFYLLQDKWDYVVKNEITSANEIAVPCRRDHVLETGKVKERPTEPCRKSNSLERLFAKRNALKKLFQVT